MDILKKSSFLLATTILFSLTSPTFAMVFEEESHVVEFHPNGRVKVQESKLGMDTTITTLRKSGKLKSIASRYNIQHFNKDGRKTHVTTPSGDPLMTLDPITEKVEQVWIDGVPHAIGHEEGELPPPSHFIAENNILTTHPNGQVKEGITEEGHIMKFYEDGSIEALIGIPPSNFKRM